jgi:alpha-tubulin suppressor-like RCC1 family protein
MKKLKKSKNVKNAFKGVIIASSLLLGMSVISSPTTVDAATKNKKELVAVGSYHSLAVQPDGTVWAWGYNGSYQLGDGTYYSKSTPIQIKGLNNILTVAAGSHSSLALKSDGTVWAWGANKFTIPTQVNGLTNVTNIVTGYSTSVALKQDGTVWEWKSDVLSPVQVPGLSGIVAISGRDTHTLALKSDGTVYAWGWNYAGQLGNGNTTDSKTPVQVNGLTGVVGIATTFGGSFALKSNGTVWSWGHNGDGELGDGTTINRSAPVQVLSNVSAIEGGQYNVVAIKYDGTTWAWGSDYYGQLGNGVTNTTSTIPIQINGLSNLKFISSGTDFTVALKQDGNLVSWGNGSRGQLGAGSTVQSSLSPIPVLKADITPPIVTVTKNPTTTSQSVTIQVTSTDSSGIKRIKLPDGTYINGSSANFTVTQNGSYTFEVEDTVGNITVTNVLVNNIQQVQLTPATFSADKTSPTNQNVILTINYPSEAIIKEYKLGDNGVWTNYQTPITIVDNVKVIARSQGSIGNISPESSYDVTNIDKIAPNSPSLSANQTTATNSDVTVTIEYPADATIKQYKIGSNGSWQNYTNPIVLTDNGTVYANAVDAAGNISGESSIAVLYIDKTPPTAPTASFDNGGLTVADGTDSGSGVQTTMIMATPVDNSVTPSSGSSTVTPMSANVMGEMTNVYGLLTTNAMSDTVIDGQWQVYTPDMKFPDGKYIFKIKTIDKAGNESPVMTIDGLIYEDALQQATNEINKAESLKTQEQLDIAVEKTKEMPEVPEKVDLLNRLQQLQTNQDILNAKNAIANATTLSTGDLSTQALIDYAKQAVVETQTLVDKIPDGDIKTGLQTQLNDVTAKVQLAQDVLNAKSIVSNATTLATADLSTQELIDSAKQEVVDAQKLVDKLPDSDIKNGLLNSLNDDTAKIQLAQDILNAKNGVAIATSLATADLSTQALIDSVDQSITDSQALVNKLPDGDIKYGLQYQLDADTAKVNVAQATLDVQNAEKLKTQDSIDTARASVAKLPNDNVKVSLTNRLDMAQKIVDANAKLDTILNSTLNTYTAIDNAIKALNDSKVTIDSLPNGIDKNALLTKYQSVFDYIGKSLISLLYHKEIGKPVALSNLSLDFLVRYAIEKVNALNIKDRGMIHGFVMPLLHGKANGNQVNDAIDTYFGEKNTVFDGSKK